MTEPSLETHFYIVPLACAIVVVFALPVLIGYIIAVERKVLAGSSLRIRPRRIGLSRLRQITTDRLKLILAKDGTAGRTDRALFWLVPPIGVSLAVLAYGLLPVGPSLQIADLNVGLVFILGISSLGFYGIVLGESTSRTHSSLQRVLRSTAKFVSYETAAALGLISALLLSGTLSMNGIVQAQLDRGQWFIFYVPVGFLIYFAASFAVGGRARSNSPDAAEGIAKSDAVDDSEFHRSLYFLAENVNVILVAGIATTVFLGGWLRPLASYRDRFPGTSIQLLDVLPAIAVIALAIYCFRLVSKQPAGLRRKATLWGGGLCAVVAAILAASLFAPEPYTQGVHGAFWFIVKMGAYIYCFVWIRFIFPPFPFDQSIWLSWRILIPAGIVNLITAATALTVAQSAGWPMRLTTILATAATVAVTVWLAQDSRVGSIVPADGE